MALYDSVSESIVSFHCSHDPACLDSRGRHVDFFAQLGEYQFHYKACMGDGVYQHGRLWKIHPFCSMNKQITSLSGGPSMGTQVLFGTFCSMFTMSRKSPSNVENRKLWNLEALSTFMKIIHLFVLLLLQPKCSLHEDIYITFSA